MPDDPFPSDHGCVAIGAKASVAVCVVGMHRSGTSCLTGCLQQAGLYLGDVVTSAPFNEKGNRESEAVQSLNDDILTHSGGSWAQPPRRLRWSAAHEVRREVILEELRTRCAWGFKDPRSLLTLPFWRAGAPELQLVGTFRHPASVARSLAARGRMSIERARAIDLWLAYNRNLMDLCRTERVALISFDLPPAEYLSRMRTIIVQLGLRAAVLDGPDEPFFDPALRRHSADGDEIVPSPAAALYRELRREHSEQCRAFPAG